MIEELITEKAEVLDKEAYYDAIVNTIIEIGRAENFIIALAELIQRLVVDHLHVLGDIYDRGPARISIMDRLMKYHSAGYPVGEIMMWSGWELLQDRSLHCNGDPEQHPLPKYGYS